MIKKKKLSEAVKVSNVISAIEGLIPLGFQQIIEGVGTYKCSIAALDKRISILAKSGNAGQGGWFLLILSGTTKSIKCLVGSDYHLQVYYKTNGTSADFWLKDREATFMTIMVLQDDYTPSFVRDSIPEDAIKIAINKDV